MPETKIKELRGLTLQELEEKLDALKKELLKLRFDARRGNIEKPSKIGKARKDIARILTIAREKRDAQGKK